MCEVCLGAGVVLRRTFTGESPMSGPRLQGYDLVAQRLLQAIFEGGCVQVCIGKCVCRNELAQALGIARDEGRRLAARFPHDDGSC